MRPADRCDRCGAQAYVRIMVTRAGSRLAVGDLQFCAHDFKKHAEHITMSGCVVLDDDRATLLAR